MEGSTTKYLPPESTDTDDTDDEEEIPTLKPAVALVDVSQASGGSGTCGSGTGGMDKEKRVNYVDLQLQDKSKKSGTKGKESLPNYVTIQSVNTAPLPPRPKVAAATPIGKHLFMCTCAGRVVWYVSINLLLLDIIILLILHSHVQCVIQKGAPGIFTPQQKFPPPPPPQVLCTILYMLQEIAKKVLLLEC